jgi:type I restriction enzyme S subunit
VKAGWRTGTLGDVCHVYQPETLAQKSLRPGPYPVFGANGEIGFHDEYNHEDPQLVLGCRGSCGTVHVTPPKTWINGNAMVVVPSERVLRDFLAYALLGGIDLSAAITGAAQPQITRKSLTPIELPLPPLPEQRRIMALLDEAFEGIAKARANAEKNIENARHLVARYRDDSFSESASTGPVRRLGDVCEFENGDRGKNYPNKQHRVAHGVPFINAGHLSEDGVDFSEMDYISVERFNLLGNGKVRPGDILFCLRGSLGKHASVGELNLGAIASSLVILRPTSSLDEAYLLSFLASSSCAVQVDRLKGGAAQPNLGARDLQQFQLPVPSLFEQKAFATRVNELRDHGRVLQKRQEEKLAALDELKKSLLHHAFAGQL